MRVVTAASLFDGHDAAINMMRRILQSQGAEVIHLGHNRSVDEVVKAAVEEDAAAVAVSSYQGGHVEYFEYLVERLADDGAGHVRVYGGGGGVIVAEEIERLARHGVKIFSPTDGQRLGLEAMVNMIIAECDAPAAEVSDVVDVFGGSRHALARTLTAIETGTLAAPLQRELDDAAERRSVPVLGITGTGGSGKSSLTDELVLRFRLDQEDKVRIAVLAVDPTRRRSGGALLGDRIRMNAIDTPQACFRSIATRSALTELPPCLPQMIAAVPGGRRRPRRRRDARHRPGRLGGDRRRRGLALRDDARVRRRVAAREDRHARLRRRGRDQQVRTPRRARTRCARCAARSSATARSSARRSRTSRCSAPIASRFNDDGVTALYQELRSSCAAQGSALGEPVLRRGRHEGVDRHRAVRARAASRYLAEIAEAVAGYHAPTDEQAHAVRSVEQLDAVRDQLGAVGSATDGVGALLDDARREVAPRNSRAVGDLRGRRRGAPAGRRRDPRVAVGQPIPRIALPRVTEPGELLRFLRAENLPGRFPFTGGVFPTKRDDEDPTRMFAGEGGPAKTNARFHYLADGQPATRLSTAFDSVTLYGADPDERPDIYGKVGNSGVSIATLDDMKVLYDGFDLVDPSTSVSMTINGPAPTILAMYLNTAIDQHPELDPAEVLERVRGTVQADILKEDQGQNTCILSTEFALRMMADIQEWFVEHEVRRFYCVSISGYHIAEAGANPISQLAFTLANGFTYVEAYLARGMDIDDFAPNLSASSSRTGWTPSTRVLGRVARRIWADRDARPLRRERALAEAEVPHPDVGPVAARAGDVVQRHPHDAAGAVRDLRQRQLVCTRTRTTKPSPRRPTSPCGGRWRSSSSSTASGASP